MEIEKEYPKNPMPSNVCTIAEHDDDVYFKVQCSCGSDECAIDVSLEASETYRNDLLKDELLCVDINLGIEATFYDHDQAGCYMDWFTNLWRKIKWRTCKACGIIFLGKVRTYKSFCFEGEEHINDFIKALEYGRDKVIACNKGVKL